MNPWVSPGTTQRQRDKLTAKRFCTAFGLVGLFFGLWVLSTPAHQIYWAAQARFAEAKTSVFNPGVAGDQRCFLWSLYSFPM